MTELQTNADSSAQTTPDLFAPGPARDERFTVVERWSDCANFERDDPRKEVEFLHRQMNEEVNGLENSARCLSDFPDADWELRLHMARQCADEVRHARAFRRLFEARGGVLGQYPVMNFQYRIITNIDSLIGRLAVQNRTFEAEGIDAIRCGIDEARGAGELELAEFYESQLADEIGHVRFANEWIRERGRRAPRELLDVARALQQASAGFREVMGNEGTEGIRYMPDALGRAEAGFSPEEIETTMQQARQQARVTGDPEDRPR